MPWFGTAFGVLCGIMLVVADQILTKKPVINVGHASFFPWDY